LDRIDTAGENNRYVRARRFGGQSRAAACDDYLHLAASKVSQQGWHLVEMPLSPAIFDCDIPAFGVAGLV
jgi:hypothetical protein